MIWLVLNVIKESYRKYQLQKEINQLKSEIERLEGENQKLSDLIKYFQDVSFLEKEAREKLNLKKPGEEVVIIPKGFFETKEKSLPEKQEKKEEPNWQKWWRYFYNN